MIDIIEFKMNKMTTVQGRAGAARASKMPVTAKQPIESPRIILFNQV
ncbi:hypothetical protein [Pseudomonas psychrophila]|nr:hypothetical protein [Pseudomonas psychrophila]EPJ95882.1 hypothetical protein CF149_02709 [Pseudomonas psychrophila]